MSNTKRIYVALKSFLLIHATLLKLARAAHIAKKPIASEVSLVVRSAGLNITRILTPPKIFVTLLALVYPRLVGCLSTSLS